MLLPLPLAVPPVSHIVCACVFKSATASGPLAQAEPGVAPLNAVSLRGGTPPVELLLVPPPSSHESPLLRSLSLTAAAAVSVVADIAAAVGIGLALLPPPWHTSGGVMRAWPFFLLLPPSPHRFGAMAVMVTFLLLRRCIRSAEPVATCADVVAYLDQGV